MSTWDTGEWRVRRRRRIRGPLTLVVLLGLLGGAAYFGYKTVIDVKPPKAVTVCQTPTADGTQRITASTVKVNVYNAGKVRGMGSQTADALRKKGFVVGTVGNAPDKTKVPGDTVQLVGRAKDAPEVQLLAGQVKHESYKADGRTTFDVDLIIGSKFAGILKKAPVTMDVKSALAACTTATPTPSSP